MVVASWVQRAFLCAFSQLAGAVSVTGAICGSEGEGIYTTHPEAKERNLGESHLRKCYSPLEKKTNGSVSPKMDALENILSSRNPKMAF